MQSVPSGSQAGAQASINRRLAATVIAAVVPVALGVCSLTLGGRTGGATSLLLFLIGLPWTVPVYVMTMVFDVTSPPAIGAILVLVTLALWRWGSKLLLRTVLTPRQR